MINGAHVVIYSVNAEADRAFFRDVLDWPHVDVGHGWLIFRMPPSEVAVHPAEANGTQELFFMTDDLEATMAQLAEHGVASTEPSDEGWGILTRITLPGGGAVGLYQPRHARP